MSATKRSSKKVPVLAISETGRVHTYESVRAAARALSTVGKGSCRTTVSNLINSGGGFVGKTFIVNGTNYLRP